MKIILLAALLFSQVDTRQPIDPETVLDNAVRACARHIDKVVPDTWEPGWEHCKAVQDRVNVLFARRRAAREADELAASKKALDTK